MFTLNEYIENPDRYPMDEVYKTELWKMVSKGCREKTKDRLKSICWYGLTNLKPKGIYDRIRFDHNGTRYNAGQSYTDEIRTIRELFLEGK